MGQALHKGACGDRPAADPALSGRRTAEIRHIRIGEWNETLSTGVGEIDEQHRYLFSLAKRLDRAIVRSNDLATLASVLQEVETVACILKELGDYASQHFETEEKYMRMCEYPEYDLHREAHARSAERIRVLEARARQCRHRFSIELAEFFDVVWRIHVLDFDRRLGAFLRAHGVS